MVGVEAALEIQVLHRHGKSIREIARETGVARNTVRRYLRDEEAARYKLSHKRRVSRWALPRISTPARPGIIDADQEWLNGRSEGFRMLARRKRWPV